MLSDLPRRMVHDLQRDAQDDEEAERQHDRHHEAEDDAPWPGRPRSRRTPRRRPARGRAAARYDLSHERGRGADGADTEGELHAARRRLEDQPREPGCAERPAQRQLSPCLISTDAEAPIRTRRSGGFSSATRTGKRCATCTQSIVPRDVRKRVRARSRCPRPARPSRGSRPCLRVGLLRSISEYTVAQSPISMWVERRLSHVGDGVPLLGADQGEERLRGRQDLPDGHMPCR